LTDLSGYAKKSTTNGDTRSGLLLRLRIVVQDPSSWAGEAKTRGTRLRSAIQTSGSGTGFRIDIGEVVLTSVGEPADHLQIESWHPGRGLERRRRR
jgi:hypothetical protein